MLDTLTSQAVPHGQRSGRRGDWSRTRGPGWGASRRSLVGVHAGRAGGPRICSFGFSTFKAVCERGDGAERSGLLESATRWMQHSSLSGIVFVRALCFGLGLSSVPQTVEGTTAQFAGATERLSPTVLEQRALQVLHMGVDRQKLEALRTESESDGLGWVKLFERRARSCDGVRRQRTGSRRSRTWTRARGGKGGRLCGASPQLSSGREGTVRGWWS